MAPKPRLLDQVRDAIRVRHYSYRTEQQYIAWIRRYILFHSRRHPREMGSEHVEHFLSHLAIHRRVAAATQAQALAALLFLYKHVLNVNLPWLGSVVRATRPKRLPTVLTRTEVRNVLAQLDGQFLLVASLMYGSGLRLLEALRLRFKDVDVDRRLVLVRDARAPGTVSRSSRNPSATRRAANWFLSVGATKTRAIMATQVSNYRTRCTANIRARTWRSVGNTCPRPPARRATRVRALGGVVMSR